MAQKNIANFVTHAYDKAMYIIDIRIHAKGETYEKGN